MKRYNKSLVLLFVLTIFSSACGSATHTKSNPTESNNPQPSATVITTQIVETDSCLSSIPIYPGAQAEPQKRADLEDLVRTMESMSQASGGQVAVYTTNDTPAAVVNYYKSHSPQGGWNKTIDLTSQEEGGIIVWEKGDFSDQMYVAVQDKGTVILLGCGPKLGSKSSTVPTFTEEDGLVGDTVTTITITADNTAWLGTTSGLSRFDGNRWTTYKKADGLPGNTITAAALGADGTLWIGTDFLGLAQFDRTTWKTVGPVEKVTSIAIAPDGSLWVSSCDVSKGGVYHYDGKDWTTYKKKNGLGDNCVEQVVVGSNGVVWAGTKKGVARLDGSTWVNFTKTEGLVDDDVSCVAVDRKGNLWVGTSAGVSRFNGEAWTTITSEKGLVNNTINAIAVAQDDSLWFGTSGGVSHLKGDVWKNYTEREGLPGNLVISIFAAQDGRIWIGTAFDGVAILTPSE